MPYFGPDSQPSARGGWRMRGWLSLRVIFIAAVELRERATVDRRWTRAGTAHVPGAGGTNAARPAAILPPEALPKPGRCCRLSTTPVAVVLPEAGFFPDAHFPTGPPLSA